MARKKYACDFETTTDENDCRVWAWAYRELYNDKVLEIGETIESFYSFFLNKDYDLYFHNLRFDGSFLLNFLLHNGYVLDRRRQPDGRTFNTTISENGQWYKIDITHGYKNKGNGESKRVHTCVYDSLKKLPFGIERIATSFGFDVLKGSLDYTLKRPKGWIITPEEREYIEADVEILARALEIQLNEGLTGSTIGSDALNEFKKLIKRPQFDKFFPVLSEKVDTYLRASYKGGFTWVKDKHKNQIIIGGRVYDVNSLYPWAMRYKHLPYGIPVFFEGKYVENKDYPLHISRLKCEFELKENMIPTIQIKQSRFQDNEYLHSSEGEQQLLTLTSVDLNLFFEHYYVYNIEWLDGYMFKQSNEFFVEYIDKWNSIKIKASVEGNKGLRELAKLMLNNLYGKFGKNPDVTPKLPFLRSDGALGLNIPRYDDGEEAREFTDPVYIAMGSFITAYAREKTITTAQKCYDRIIYCDTDSIHLLGKEIPKEIEEEIDDNKLGYWKHETTFNKGKFIRQKTYVEMYTYTFKTKNKRFKITRQKTDIKCAGMPDRIKKKLTFEQFKQGFTTATGKLTPKQVKGGVVLEDGSFTLK